MQISLCYRQMKNARHTPAIRERMADGSEGSRMRRIKGARHAHKTIRASGRVPGQEARAALAVKRERERILGQQWRYGNTMEN